VQPAGVLGGAHVLLVTGEPESITFFEPASMDVFDPESVAVDDPESLPLLSP
jgi:hypothetical protein